jgi:hypothetical protein
VTLRTERPPVRPRSGRRPLPPLIFLLVLAVAAGAVWWNVMRQEAERKADQAAACASVEKAPPSLDPATVSVRVYNATDQGGLAQKVAADLQGRGFNVTEIANDPSTGREVTGTGEVRHGRRGDDPAAFVAAFLPDAGDFLDTRATDVVDLVVGPEFTALATPEEVAAALAVPAEVAAAC